MHPEISPAPQKLSPSLEPIIPKSVVIISTQDFVASRFASVPLASRADHFAVLALQTCPLFLVLWLASIRFSKGTASSVIPQTPIESVSLKFADFARLSFISGNY